MSGVKWYHGLSDLANLFKAFIGTNYLSIAYGFKEAGLMLALVGLVLTAILNDHCCNLIVKLKYLAMQRYCHQLKLKDVNPVKVNKIYEEMRLNLSYSDVACILIGRKGEISVKTFLLITQCGFCINYPIFIGNVLHTILIVDNSQHYDTCRYVNSSLKVKNDSDDINTTELVAMQQSNLSLCTLLVPNVSNVGSQGSQLILALLVLSPLPFLLAFSLLRNIRAMGIISMTANTAIIFGCGAVIFNVINGFTISPDVVLMKWITFPVYIGIVTSSYEAIGTILSIEASMVGTRHLYPCCLHAVVVVFSLTLFSMGILGYLHYGESTQQILLQNLHTGNFFGVIVNLLLLVGVLFTFPLQVYPVIEIFEKLLFSSGSVSEYSAVTFSDHCSEEEIEFSEGHSADTQTLLPDSSVQLNIVKELSPDAPTWKRNVLRIFIAIGITAMSVILRNVIAYVGAFVGSLGSIPLAYIIPCWMHSQKEGIHRCSKLKDYFVIVLGIFLVISGVVVTIFEIYMRV